MAKLYTHPEYQEYLDEWTELDDLYRGEHKTLSSTKYLWPHLIEENFTDPIAKKLRAAREKRTRYLNIPEIVLSVLISLLFRKKPQISDPAESMLGDAIDNIDGLGNSLLQVIKNKLARDYLLYGKALTLVSRAPTAARNRAEEQAQGARAYLDTICPLAAPDWNLAAEQVGSTQHFDFFRHEYTNVTARTSETQKPETELFSDAYVRSGDGVIVNRYKRRVDDKTGIYIQDKDGENWNLSDSFALELSQIPIAAAVDESWLKGVAQETLRFHNLRSNRDNINYNQGYQRLWGAGLDPNDPNIVKGLSEYTMMLVPEGATINALLPADPQALERAEQESLANAFRMGLNQLRLLPADSRAVEGADTVAEQKDNTIALMEGVIEDIENLTNTALAQYAEFTGETADMSDAVTLARDFTPESVEQFVMIYNAFVDKFRAAPDVDKIMLKRALSKLNLSDTDLAAAEKAVDAADFNKPSEADRQDKLAAVLNGRAP